MMKIFDNCGSGMKWYFLLIILFVLLNACASGPAMKVRISDGRSDYSIYRDGELVCTRSDSCEFSTPVENESMYIQVCRNNVIYGGVRVYRESGTSLPSRGVEKWMRSTHPSDAFELVTGMFTLPVFFLTPSKIAGQFPAEVVLTVGPKDSVQANFPWEKPIQ